MATPDNSIPTPARVPLPNSSPFKVEMPKPLAPFRESQYGNTLQADEPGNLPADRDRYDGFGRKIG